MGQLSATQVEPIDQGLQMGWKGPQFSQEGMQLLARARTAQIRELDGQAIERQQLA